MTIYQIIPNISVVGITIPRVVYDSSLVKSPEAIKEMEVCIIGLLGLNIFTILAFIISNPCVKTIHV